MACPAASKEEAKRENVLCHVDWSVLQLRGEKRSMCSVMLTGCPAAGQWGSEKKARNG